MKKIIIRILTLAAIFVLAVVGFYWYLNQGTTDTTETMAEATFPLVYMKNGDSLLNCLHGYTQEMDVTAMRDTLTPLENDRTLNLRIDPYKKKISDISYEVLSADGSRTLENTQVNKTEEQDGYLNVTLSLQDNLLFLEPLEYRDSTKIQDLVIAIDTSGSCSLETVSRFLSETLVILSSSENFFKKMNVHLIQCDSAIQSHTVIHSAEEWMENSRKIRILGRGGTDFTPVFSYVKELLEKKELTHLKGLLYFTDGDGIYPTSPPPYETAFVFTDFSFLNYPVPAFITKLCLETNQAGNEVFQYEH